MQVSVSVKLPRRYFLIVFFFRINRIIEGPRGNALLVGVGGSGKQSLARLAAYISSLSVTQIQLRRGYGMTDLKIDLNTLYMKVGVKNIQSMFLMTDAQVTDESFLVIINDMLASGEVSELFSDDELDTIINAMRNEVKQLGIVDSKENCWKHFIDKVRRMLKVGFVIVEIFWVTNSMHLDCTMLLTSWFNIATESS